MAGPPKIGFSSIALDPTVGFRFCIKNKLFQIKTDPLVHTKRARKYGIKISEQFQVGIVAPNVGKSKFSLKIRNFQNLLRCAQCFNTIWLVEIAVL